VFLANDLGNKSPRQFQTPGAASQRKIAKGFEVREVEGKRVRPTDVAQNAALQRERLSLQSWNRETLP
jgi:hypothetical protein